MYEKLSVATTGFSWVASPPRPMTKSLPAARPGREGDGQDEQRGRDAVEHAGLLQGASVRKVGSRTSRRPSPTRLNPNTVTKIASPGKVATHHAEARNWRPST